ncbi:glucokinase [Parabacteroides sp. PF5-5]|uniref:ROK family protein n=1 Tax=unclassified Parabacteroides TaxID=2649774 RepID=UPI00247392E9|nr:MULTISPECIES: ROK family protein [unclassified Parabacteroides]MDH6304912.1 glucokinase [Parabacteroides sp. PH5-39]MDH6316002.1 glucokinase [Parabacteroides sp. PF5-13]MDH6319659.1 glucokinase [Parabacteroides sp. PH5-13]MDH6323390.1 glucokinase [Parabacteroides sp. PH5-8]MDH6327101.1 glucokinase [Parabacteroides sp. PH5-41]
METYLGIDLGGTKLLIGEVDSSGNILKYKKYDSGYFNQQSALDIIKTSLDNYIQTVGWTDKKPLGMGVGLIGRVDPEKGIWLQIDPSRTQPIPLAQELFDLYGIPCHIDNDVKSATRAERHFGFGQLSRNFIYINVGTGIAAGFVINGRQIRGSHFNAGEVGHTQVGVNIGVRCGCGRMDCVEQIAAGIGFDSCARLLKPRFETNLFISENPGERVNIKEVFDLSKKGDPLCVELVENASLALANLIMNLVRVSDPDTVVLGGGLVSDGYIHTKILEKLNANTIRFVKNGVVITKLNPDFIGLIGAGAVAMNV